MLLQLLTTSTIEIVTSSTAQIDYTWGAVDLDATTGIVMDDAVGGSGAITTATTTTVVAAPAASGRRQIKHLSLYNLGTAANTVRAQLDANGTNRVIRQWVLQPGESVLYTDTRGWEVCNVAGVPKSDPQQDAVDGRSYSLHKVGTAAEAAGQWYAWAKDGGNPGAWVPGTPGLAGRATDGTTAADAGCLPIPNSAGSDYVTGFDGVGTVTGHVGLWDFLWVNSGIVVTTTTAQTINSVAFPARDSRGTTDGYGVEVMLYVTVATTNAGAITNTTMSYTNEAGVAGRTATMASFPATAVAGTAAFFILQAGDHGVRSIQTVTLGTSRVAGTIHLLAARSIMNRGDIIANVSTVSIPAGQVDPRAGVRIYDGKCLVAMGVRAATTATNIFGNVYVATR